MMKFRNLFASIGLLASIGTMAQSIPTHDMYVDFGHPSALSVTIRPIWMIISLSHVFP